MTIWNCMAKWTNTHQFTNMDGSTIILILSRLGKRCTCSRCFFFFLFLMLSNGLFMLDEGRRFLVTYFWLSLCSLDGRIMFNNSRSWKHCIITWPSQSFQIDTNSGMASKSFPTFSYPVTWYSKSYPPPWFEGFVEASKSKPRFCELWNNSSTNSL
jgi:hypothetical protein